MSKANATFPLQSAPLPNANNLNSQGRQQQQPSGSALANDFQQTYGEGQQGPNGEQQGGHYK